LRTPCHLNCSWRQDMPTRRFGSPFIRHAGMSILWTPSPSIFSEGCGGVTMSSRTKHPKGHTGPTFSHTTLAETNPTIPHYTPCILHTLCFHTHTVWVNACRLKAEGSRLKYHMVDEHWYIGTSSDGGDNVGRTNASLSHSRVCGVLATRSLPLPYVNSWALCLHNDSYDSGLGLAGCWGLLATGGNVPPSYAIPFRSPYAA